MNENEKIDFDAPAGNPPKTPIVPKTPEQPKQENKQPVNNSKSLEIAKATILKDLQAETMDKVEVYVTELQKAGEIKLPENYAVGNNLRLAWMQLLETKDMSGKLALDVCTRASIANALLKMSIQGLSIFKKQCAFIVRGDKLCCDTQYGGQIALAKRYRGVIDVNANAVYKDDIFVYEINPITGIKKVIKHEQKLENMDGDIVGAYAILTFPDREPFTDIMTMKEIKQSWMQGPMKGQSPAHKNFPGEMCKKTVESRACKPFIMGSDDEDLFPSENEQPLPKTDKPVLDIITPCEDVTPKQPKKEQKEVKEVKFED